MVTVYEHYVEHLPPDSKHRPHSVLLLSYIYCRLAIEVRQAVGLDFKDDLSYVLGVSMTFKMTAVILMIFISLFYGMQASPVKLVKPLIQLLEFIAWELLKASDSRPVPQMVQHQQFFRRMQNKDLSSILNLFSSWDNLEAAASLKVHVSSASKPGDEGDPRYHIQESYACKYEALKAVAKARNLGALGNHYLHSCCHLVLRGENHPYPSSIVARYLDVIYQSVWTLFHKEFSKAQCYLRALNEIIANKKNKATAAELNKDTEIIDTLEELVTLFQNTDEKYDNLLLKCSSDIHKGCHFVVEKVKYTCGCKRPLHFEKHCKGN